MTEGHFVATNRCRCERRYLETHLGAVRGKFEQRVWLYTQSILAERGSSQVSTIKTEDVSFFGFFRLCTVDT